MHRRTLSLTPPPLSTTRGRLILIFALTLLTTLVYLLTPKSTLTTLRHHIPGAHPYVKPASPPALYGPIPDPPAATPPPGQLVVKTQIPGEDLRWLLPLRPEWRNQVISLDAAFAKLHQGAGRVDKGRIVDAYLSWIIMNYENLASTVVFVPPGPAGQEEASAVNEEVVQRIQSLDVEFVAQRGFAALTCPTEEECADLVLPSRDPPDEYRTLEINMAAVWKGLFNSTLVPEKLAKSGGGAFAVSKKQIRSRTVEEYTRYWEWLARTKMDDDTAGEVVEALWHVIFGREETWCPDEKECRCDVFGEC
ncbi:hypothetical protein SVAN01_00049 [Stagonosporopsis vannaccii]|nr:hypothetical protein SVAN01_00049 [Stagonosporopsis vannaccii]